MGSVAEFQNAFPQPVRAVATVAVVVLTAVAYLGALFTVELQRHGGARGWAWWRKPSELIAVALPRRRTPFASPARAQFWFEWRRNGVVLPFCVAFVLLFIIGPILGTWGRIPEVTLLACAWSILLPIFLAGFVG